MIDSVGRQWSVPEIERSLVLTEYQPVGINLPVSVKIKQLFSLMFYFQEFISIFWTLRARFCRFALTNAKITQKIGRFAPPGLYFLGRFAPFPPGLLFFRKSSQMFRSGVRLTGVLILTLWYRLTTEQNLQFMRSKYSSRALSTSKRWSWVISILQGELKEN